MDKAYQWKPYPAAIPEWVQVIDSYDGATYTVSGLEGIRRGRRWTVDPAHLILPGRPLTEVEAIIWG